MPSRNNPNLPSAEKRKVRTRKAALKANKHAPRPCTSTRATAGVKKASNTNAKRQKKLERNKIYANQRAVEIAADELLKKTGEAEMKDVATVPLTKRQQKLAERAAAAAEHNAKTRAAQVTFMDTATATEIETEAEPTMDVD